MAYPYTQLIGDVRAVFTATATGAVGGSTPIEIAISPALPVVEQLADIAIRFKIPKSAQFRNGRPTLKITFNGSDLNLGQTFAAQGVHYGSVMVLANA